MKLCKYKECKRYNSDIWGLLALNYKSDKMLPLVKEIYRYRVGRRFDYFFRIDQNPKKYTKRKRLLGRFISEKRRLYLFYGNIERRRVIHILSSYASLNKLGYGIINLLENTIFVLVYRINFANNIFLGKEYVEKGYFLVNRKVICNVNYLLRDGDVIEVVEDKKFEVFKDLCGRLEDGTLLSISNSNVNVDFSILVAHIIYCMEKISYLYRVDSSVFNKLYCSKLF